MIRLGSTELISLADARTRFSSGSIAWVTAFVPKKLVSKVRRTDSSLAVSGDPSPMLVMPALLTKMSSRPSRASMSAAAAAIVSGFVKSICT